VNQRQIEYARKKIPCVLNETSLGFIPVGSYIYGNTNHLLKENTMDRLKKLAGIINENETGGLMNKVNKVTDPQTKNMLSNVAVLISDIEGYLNDMEETFARINSPNYIAKHKSITPADIRDFDQDSEYAYDAVRELARTLEAYITRVYG
jgi:hypothetical protein